MRLILLFLLGSLAICARAFAADPVADATAKFLAGLPVRNTPLESFANTPGWAQHATELDRAWQQVEKRQLSKIRAWAPQALGTAYEDTGPMFYMFSGPDFLYANAFFPNASTYILCGIEPVGAIPDLEKIPRGVLPSSLSNLRKSLDAVLSFSFFITKNMKVDLKQKQLNGTLPVLYFFLARTGYTIDSVALVALDREGNFVPEGKGTTPGAKIVFSGKSGRQQTLYYFSSDVADWAVKTNPNFGKFCELQGQGLTLLKAASYLMHSDNFSQVRGFLLAHSKIIVQDDSGIPFRFFKKDKWDIHFHGRYLGPINRFLKNGQLDLAKENAAAAPQLLPFSFGYQWQPSRSSLIVATPK
ncbi:MAG: hypothetical protein DLM73_04325 [Chthoniobacterales bacterium]|nr:MAG: hypothetical protein DLM73_04325 [Chthoniobacterales bacterium]